MTPNQQYYELSDVDEVERMRQVRRHQEEQFDSAEAYFDWMTGLQRQHDRRKKARATRRTGSPKQSARTAVRKRV